ncbi:MAG: alternative ribosome rescue aminoacyl-tRNA hydrolase ArfB [Actinomycetota bacterium]
MEGVRINRSLVIPRHEVQISFAASGGPGGQHANKTATRVELTWNIRRSQALGPWQRERLERKLASRINSEGDLRIVADEYRSQWRNRSEAERRLVKVVSGALHQQRSRVDTKPTKASKERRLTAKRRRSEIKKTRRLPPPD